MVLFAHNVTCQTYVFQWPPLGLGISGGEGEGVVGPQVNEFELVSSDDHQMSVVGE